MATIEDFGRCLAIQECPQCHKKFKLAWQDWYDHPQTMFIRWCPSGGVYDVSIKCSHCDYEEPL